MKKSILALLAFAAYTNIQAQEVLLKPEQTEFYEPVPPIVTPATTIGEPPSDAIVLFNGKNLDNFVKDVDGSAVKWTLDKNGVILVDNSKEMPPATWTINADGSMTVKPGTGGIKTKKKFGDCQLHIEWKSPMEPDSLTGQRKGNSGVFFQERYEIQILNSWKNKTYTNGQAGSVYKQTPPLANACRPVGEWTTYDIIFTAPHFNRNGGQDKAGMVTVIHNGIVVQNATILQGTTEYIGAPKIVAHGKGSIKLQDHGNLVSYRNIWIREL